MRVSHLHPMQQGLVAHNDLVDPDATQALEPVIGSVDVVPDAGDDRPDGALGDPHPPGHRGLRGLGRQPRHLIVEGVGVASVVPCPGNRGDHNPMIAAPHPRRGRFQLGPDGAQVQCAPCLRPGPRSHRGLRRWHFPHRPRGRAVGRTCATSTPASSSNSTRSSTAFSIPSRLCHRPT